MNIINGPIAKVPKSDEPDLFAHVSSPSSRLLFDGDNDNDDKKPEPAKPAGIDDNNPFADMEMNMDIEAEFKALASKMDDLSDNKPKSKLNGHEAAKSGDDMILDMFNGEDSKSKQQKSHNVEPSGNDKILDIFSGEADIAPAAPAEELPSYDAAIQQKAEKEEKLPSYAEHMGKKE